jgi:alkylhydroperoxidase/carboxymuconolactone decarboxylase family protein YurZ
VIDHAETLRKLSICDCGLLDSLVADPQARLEVSSLDARTFALAQLAALVAVDAAPPSYLDAIAAAREAGADDDEIVGALVATIPAVGQSRVVSAAPKLALALGYDVGHALEERR